MIRSSIAFVIGLLSIKAWGAPTENGVPCQIVPFQKSVFEESLLLDNHLMCPGDGPTIETSQFCEHLYKCPLDFSEKTRHCEAVCRRDGTWDYKYPSCEDLVPLAELLQLKLLEERWQILEKRRRRRRGLTARFQDADAIIDALEKKKLKDDDIVIGDYTQTRIKRSAWVLVKPPKSSKTTEAPPTPTPESTPKGVVSKEKLIKFCRLKMCGVLKAKTNCKTIEDLKMPDYRLQTRVCQLCVLLGACKNTLDMFSSG